jgi:hypothetical protein
MCSLYINHVPVIRSPPVTICNATGDRQEGFPYIAFYLLIPVCPFSPNLLKKLGISKEFYFMLLLKNIKGFC